MNEILSYSQMETLVILLMMGGGILFLWGLGQILSRAPHVDLRGRGRPKPMAPLGIGLCALGLVLGISWHVI